MNQLQSNTEPIVSIVAGTTSDFPLRKKATEILDNLSVSNELRVVSAHRTPDWLYAYAESAVNRVIIVIIAGAGGAAGLFVGAAGGCILHFLLLFLFSLFLSSSN